MGADTSDDAAVYKLTNDLALISTLDFFTPMLDDPYSFGQVAAANAISDVYAMGGRPFLALNIVAFPRCLSLDILEAILQGGADKVLEAGARLAGGHSIADDTPKYGLAINGLVHPDKVWTNAGSRPGDFLVLTKPLGSGIVCTAIKAGAASLQETQTITEIMTTLNLQAAEAAKDLAVHACTDVTGFGLLGHLAEMMVASRTCAEIEFDQIPQALGAFTHAQSGNVPGGVGRNRDFIQGSVGFAREMAKAEVDLLYDPQTSGGLLFSLAKDDANELVAEGLGWLIGQVLPGGDKKKLLNIL